MGNRATPLVAYFARTSFVVLRSDGSFRGVARLPVPSPSVDVGRVSVTGGCPAPYGRGVSS
jgi:hypothetical protein